MADPDLQIRGGGVGHPDHKIRGGGLKNFFFLPFGPQFGLEVSGAGCGGGGGGPPGPLPWIRHRARPFIHCLYFTCPRKNYATVETHH